MSQSVHSQLGVRHVKPVLALARHDTIATARASVANALAVAGIESPDLDARLLICAACNIEASALIAHPERTLGDDAPALVAYVSRRLADEPVSRILGFREFYGRQFEISPATLDPRPDTETLVDAVLATVRREGWKQKPLRLLDIGTGSGCLAVTLLAELPYATAVATDISSAALEIASKNAQRLGVFERLACRIANGLEGICEHFDFLVANPPYIPTADIAGLAGAVRCYDPMCALDGGLDGLAIYRTIVPRISSVVPNGYVFLEVGYDQAAAVSELLLNCGLPLGWPSPTIVNDLGGRPRCVAQKTLR